MLNLAHTALVVIDLQEDILNAAPLAPNSLDDMLTANTRLTTVLKNTSALIALVSVETATFTHLYPFAAEKRSIPTLTNAPTSACPSPVIRAPATSSASPSTIPARSSAPTWTSSCGALASTPSS